MKKIIVLLLIFMCFNNIKAQVLLYSVEVPATNTIYYYTTEPIISENGNEFNIEGKMVVKCSITDNPVLELAAVNPNQPLERMKSWPGKLVNISEGSSSTNIKCNADPESVCFKTNEPLPANKMAVLSDGTYVFYKSHTIIPSETGYTFTVKDVQRVIPPQKLNEFKPFYLSGSFTQYGWATVTKIGDTEFIIQCTAAPSICIGAQW